MKRTVLTICAGLALVTTSAPQIRAEDTNQSSSSTEQQKQLGKVQQARDYIGKDVKDQSGERLGKLEDFVVDLESGHILFGVVNAGGASRGVPAEMLKPASDQKSLTINSDKQQMNKAPEIPKEEAAQLSSADFAKRIARHFNQTTWYSQGETGKDFGNVHRVSQLSNMDVESSSNEKVGQIRNVLVDLKTGYVTFLILDPSEMLGEQNQQYAVPPNAFTKGSGNTLITGIDKDTLSNGPKYNNNVAELSDTSKAGAIYSHYGKQPYWNLSPTGRE